MQDKKDLQNKDFQKASGDIRKDVSSQGAPGYQAGAEKLPAQQGQQQQQQKSGLGVDVPLRKDLSQDEDVIRKNRDLDQASGPMRQAQGDTEQPMRKGLNEVDTDENLRRGAGNSDAGGLKSPGADKGTFRK